jgi:hypothetical protein
VVTKGSVHGPITIGTPFMRIMSTQQSGKTRFVNSAGVRIV